MRPDRIDHFVDPGADHEAKLQNRLGVAGNGIGRLLDIAGRHRQHFERVPCIKPLGRRQTFLTPIFGERRLVRHRFDLHVSERRADLVGNARRLQFVQQQASLAVDKTGDRTCQDGRGIGKDAAPVAGMMRTFAQVHVKMNPYSTTAAEEDGGTIRRKPRPVRGQEQIGLELLAQLLAYLAQIRRSDLLAGFNDEFASNPSLPPRVSRTAASADKLMLCCPLLSAVPRP